MKIKNFEAIKAIVKTGNEKLTFLEEDTAYSLLQFWQWSVSDILSNATRGRFAEFIVGTAIEFDVNALREEWDAYDLITKSGIKIEIKSSSYIQSWAQFNLSKISFSIKPAKHVEMENKNERGDAKRHADVYVFCLLKHKDQKTINPLKLEQWDFFVVPTYKLDINFPSQNSISLNSLLKISEAITYDRLNEMIEKEYRKQINYH